MVVVGGQEQRCGEDQEEEKIPESHFLQHFLHLLREDQNILDDHVHYLTKDQNILDDHVLLPSR